MGLSSHGLARLLLSLPDQPEVTTLDGDLVIGAEDSTYGDDEGIKPCITLETEE